MKQLVILSGKGGTGKTTVASSFIRLLDAHYFADCDVDAPNLHLLNKMDLAEQNDFYGQNKAQIDLDKCIGCRTCMDVCKFDAIEPDKNKVKVNEYNCEGCGVCELVCPLNAISLKKSKAGDLYLYKSNNKVFSSATLKMGSGTSGKLVTDVKKQLLKYKDEDGIAIIDGSPGIGCPVIASLSGADAVLIVSEPSMSGISDLERIVKTALGFQAKVFVAVNKYDINVENTTKIKEYCKKNNIEFVGTIPYDKMAVKLVNEGKSVVDVDCKAGRAIQEVFKNTMKYFEV